MNSGEYLIKEKNSQQIKELNPVFDQTFDSIAINENTKFQVYINDELKFEETGPKLISNSYYKNNTSQNDALYTIHEEARLRRCPEDETKRVSLAFKPSDNVLSDEYQFNILENCKQKLASYMIPDDIIFLSEMPLTAAMKTDLKQLNNIYNEYIDNIDSKKKVKRK